MERDYPVETFSTLPRSGKLLLDFLYENVSVTADFLRQLEMYQAKELLSSTNSAFRGALPVGQELMLKSYDGQEYCASMEQNTKSHRFDGKEGIIYVKDLAEESRNVLNIPSSALPGEVVFDPAYGLPFALLPVKKQRKYVLPGKKTISVMKGYLNTHSANQAYSERNVLLFLKACFDAGSRRALRVIETLHDARALPYFMRSKLTDDEEFHKEHPPEFYLTYLKAAMPTLCLAYVSLGKETLKLKSDLFEYDDIRYTAAYMDTNYSFSASESYIPLENIIDTDIKLQQENAAREHAEEEAREARKQSRKNKDDAVKNKPSQSMGETIDMFQKSQDVSS